MQYTGAALPGPIDLQKYAKDKPESLEAQAGAHVFACPNPTLFAYMTQYASRITACGGSVGGITFPKLPTTLLFSGTERAQHEMTIFSSKINAKASDASRTFQAISHLPIDWTRNEGTELVARHVVPETCCVLQRPQTEPVSAAACEGIMRLDRWARHSNIHVMLITLATSSKDFAMLASCVTDLFRVTPAEEDPGSRLAFAIGSHDLDYRHCLGVGREFVQVNVLDSMMLAFEVEKHIADTMVDRVIWKCLSSGLTQAEAGAIVGLDKSNVCRRACKLPRMDLKKPAEGWWRLYADVFTFSEEVQAKLGG